MIVVISGREICIGWRYLLAVVVATCTIKAIMSFVRAWQEENKLFSKATATKWCAQINNVDYIVAFGVGTIEVLIYPVLIYSGAWQPITWWLGIKTAARWRWRPRKPKNPNEDERASQRYTNFLFGNALAVLAALLLTQLVNK